MIPDEQVVSGLVQQLKWMSELWTPEDPRDMNELFIIVRKLIGVSEKDDPSPDTVERAINEHVIVPITILKAKFHTHGLLNTSVIEEAAGKIMTLSKLIWNQSTRRIFSSFT